MFTRSISVPEVPGRVGSASGAGEPESGRAMVSAGLEEDRKPMKDYNREVLIKVC